MPAHHPLDAPVRADVRAGRCTVLQPRPHAAAGAPCSAPGAPVGASSSSSWVACTHMGQHEAAWQGTGSCRPCRPVPQPAAPLCPCPCPPSPPTAGGSGRAAAGAGRAEHNHLRQPQVWCVAWPASPRGCLGCMWALCCTWPTVLMPFQLAHANPEQHAEPQQLKCCRQDEALLVPPGKEGAHPRTGGPAVAARCAAAARDPARHAAGGCLSPSLSCCAGGATLQERCQTRSWRQPSGVACRMRQLSCRGYCVRRARVW